MHIAEAYRAGATLAWMHAVGPVTTDAVDSWYTERSVGEPWQDSLPALSDRRDPLADAVDRALARLAELESLIVPPEPLMARFFSGYASVAGLPSPIDATVFGVSVAASLNFIAEHLHRIVSGRVGADELERARTIVEHGLANLPSLDELQWILGIWRRCSD